MKFNSLDLIHHQLDSIVVVVIAVVGAIVVAKRIWATKKIINLNDLAK